MFFVFLRLFVLHHVVHYPTCFVGTEPPNGAVAVEPRLLFFGVTPRVLLYHLDGVVACPSAIEVVEQLFVADRVQRIQLSVRIQVACLVFQSIVQHVPHTSVDALVQLGTWTREPNLDNVERALFELVRALLRKRAACYFYHFQCVQHAFHVAQIDFGVMLRIEQFQLAPHAIDAVLGVKIHHAAACFVVDGGQIVDAAAHCVGVEHRTANHQRIAVLRYLGFDDWYGVQLKLSGAVRLENRPIAYKMVFYGSQLCGGRGGCADGQLAKHLARIARHDAAAQKMCHFQADVRFADACWPDYDKQCSAFVRHALCLV